MTLSARQPNAFVSVAIALGQVTAWANIGVNTVNPVAGLDVSTTGSASAIIVPWDTTANRPTTPANGMLWYNTTANAMEMFVNGGWMQVAAQPLGSTANVTPSGPSSASVYAVSAVTCNYTPGFGACANVNSGTRVSNGTNTTSNATCVQIQGMTSQAILYDLGSNKTINNLYITQEAHVGLTQPQLSFSIDNVTFTSGFASYGSGYSSSTIYQAYALSPNVVARYVRLMNGASSANSANGVVCNLAVGP